MDNDYKLMIEQTDFYKLLSDEEKELVKENIYYKEYGKNEIVHSCTGVCLGMIFVISGSIRTSIISEEGRELTLFKVGANDTCVLSAACVLHEIRLDSSMSAERDTSAIVLDSKTLAKIVSQNIAVKSYCYEIATKRFSAALFVLQEIILLRFDQRLARYLVDTAEQSKDRVIHTTQEAIASDVNSAREVVARMLKQFETDNLVKLGRGSIEIVDMESLKLIL